MARMRWKYTGKQDLTGLMFMIPATVIGSMLLEGILFNEFSIFRFVFKALEYTGYAFIGALFVWGWYKTYKELRGYEEDWNFEEKK